MTEAAARSDAPEQMTTPGDADRTGDARSNVDRWFALYPAIALAALLPLGAVTPLFPVEVGVVTFALGTLAIGMAHGAVDHLVPLRAASGVSLRRSVAVVSVVYAILGGAVIVAFFLAPVAAFVGFVALTWLHWGQGDVASLVVAGVEHLPTSAERWLTLVVRGGLPMGVPLLGHPGEYRLVAEWMIGLFVVDAGAAAAAVDPVFTHETLLAVFFTIHDPTTPNRQGADVGPQYRSIILWENEDQRDTANAVIQRLTREGAFPNPIVTEVAPLERFYPAEAHHQDYYLENAPMPYCQMVIEPKLKKAGERFSTLMRDA